MIWGTIAGILGGAFQDGLSYFKEIKAKEQNFKHEIALEKVRSENKVREFQAGIEIAKEETKQADFKFQAEQEKTYGVKATAEACVEIAEKEVEKAWYKNITKATQCLKGDGFWTGFTNFLIGTARPIITYFLGFLMFWIVLHHQGFEQAPKWFETFIIMLAFQFEATVSFWFYRRGSDKMREFDFQKKK